MTDPAYTHDHFKRMLSKFEEVSQWVEAALATVAEAEMLALSKRFPNRRIELHSGMGSTQIVVEKRHKTRWEHDYTYAGPLAWTNWPEGLEVPAPGLWEAIAAYEDEFSHGKDPAFGTIFYENGKKIKGLGDE